MASPRKHGRRRKKGFAYIRASDPKQVERYTADRKSEAVNKSPEYAIYHRQGHDVPLPARQKWALELERVKCNAESRGMTATLEFIEFDNTTISYFSATGATETGGGRGAERLADAPARASEGKKAA